MHRAQSLLRRRDEVLILSFSRHVVQLFVELAELGAGGHDTLAHKKGRMHGGKPALVQEGNRELDHGLVQQSTGTDQVVAATAGNIHARLQVHQAA